MYYALKFMQILDFGGLKLGFRKHHNGKTKHARRAVYKQETHAMTTGEKGERGFHEQEMELSFSFQVFRRK